MIVLLSDTHATDGLSVGGALARDLRRADLAIHAGDFTTEAVLDELRATTERLIAVYGNADEPPVRDRLPEAQTFVESCIRFVVTHRQQGGETGLVYLGRERGADVVVSGHTHRPLAKTVDDVILLNPGSHAQPRGGHPTYATMAVENGAIRGAIRTTDGTVVADIAPEGRNVTGDGR